MGTPCPLDARVIRQIVRRDFPSCTVFILDNSTTTRCSKDGGNNQCQSEQANKHKCLRVLPNTFHNEPPFVKMSERVFLFVTKPPRCC